MFVLDLAVMYFCVAVNILWRVHRVLEFSSINTCYEFYLRRSIRGVFFGRACVASLASVYGYHTGMSLRVTLDARSQSHMT